MLGELSQASTDLWIVCHGFGQLARDFLEGFEPISQKGRVIVAPEALSRFYRSPGAVHTAASPVGATWMTREDRDSEIGDYVAYLDTLLAKLRSWIAPDAKVTVLGFSQGAATASRWIANSAPEISRLILWGGLLPPELRDAGRIGGLSRQPVQFVVGTSDRYFQPDLVRAERQALETLGIAFSLIQFDGGHVIDGPTLSHLEASSPTS